MHNTPEADVFTSPFQEIDDSDPPNAANFDTPIEALANRTRYLKNRLGHGAIGSGGTFLRDVVTVDDNRTTQFAPFATYTTFALTSTNTFFDSGIITLLVTGTSALVANDLVITDWQFSYETAGAGTFLYFAVFRSLDGSGGTYFEVPGSAVQIPHVTANEPVQVRVRSVDTVLAGQLTGHSGVYAARLFGAATMSSPPINVNVAHSWNATGHWYGVVT